MPNCPEVRNLGKHAYYTPVYDYINMPLLDDFIGGEEYYGTLFHELIHSTGHAKRLNRKEIADTHTKGLKSYSQEELTAEIGACFLKSYAGIMEKTFEPSLAYLQGWLARLQNDKRFIFYASSQAQKATDYILGINMGEKEASITVAEKEE